MQRPIIITCFDCGSKVHQFEDDLFGCEKCKCVWSYDNSTTPHGWISNRDKNEQLKIVDYPLISKRKNQK